jgi:hypothetical protein
MSVPGVSLREITKKTCGTRLGEPENFKHPL